MAVSYKTKCILTIGPRSFTLRRKHILTKMGMQISITNKTRKNPNIHQLMCVDKQIVIYPYKRTLLSDKKESTSNTRSNMDESHG